MSQVASLTIGVGANLGQFNAGMQQFKATLDQATKDAQSFSTAMASTSDMGAIAQNATRGLQQASSQAKTFVTNLSRDFDQGMTEAREAMLKGLLSPAEFDRVGRVNTKAYNAAIQQELRNLDAAKALSPEAQQTLIAGYRQMGVKAGEAMGQGIAQGTQDANAGFALLGRNVTAADGEFTEFGHRGAHAMIGVGFAVEALANGSESGMHRALHAVEGFALAFGTNGLLFAGLATAAFGIYEFWHKAEEEAEQAKQKFEEAIKSLADAGRGLSIQVQVAGLGEQKALVEAQLKQIRDDMAAGTPVLSLVPGVGTVQVPQAVVNVERKREIYELQKQIDALDESAKVAKTALDSLNKPSAGVVTPNRIAQDISFLDDQRVLKDAAGIRKATAQLVTDRAQLLAEIKKTGGIAAPASQEAAHALTELDKALHPQQAGGSLNPLAKGVQLLEDQAKSLAEAFDAAAAHGQPVTSLFATSDALTTKILATLAQYPSLLDKNHAALLHAVDDLDKLNLSALIGRAVNDADMEVLGGKLGLAVADGITKTLKATLPGDLGDIAAGAVAEMAKQNPANILHDMVTRDSVIRMGFEIENVGKNTKQIFTPEQREELAQAKRAVQDIFAQIGPETVGPALDDFAQRMQRIRGDLSSGGIQLGAPKLVSDGAQFAGHMQTAANALHGLADAATALGEQKLGSLLNAGGNLATNVGAFESATTTAQSVTAAFGMLGSGIAILSTIFSGDSVLRRESMQIQQQANARMQDLANKLAGFTTNAVTASQVGSFLNATETTPFAHGGGLDTIGLMGGFGAQMKYLQPILDNFGLTLGQVEQVAKDYGFTILNANGTLNSAGLNAFAAGIQSATDAAYHFGQTLTLQESQTLFSLQDQFAGRTSSTDQVARDLKIIDQMTPDSSPLHAPTFDLTSAAGQSALRQWFQGVIQQVADGSLSNADFGSFQSLNDFLSLAGDAAGALNSLGDAANSVTAALTNVPAGFKIAMDRYLASAPTMPVMPGTDSVGPFIPSPTPPLLSPTSPTLISRSGSGSAPTAITHNDGDVNVTFEVNVNSSAPDAKSLADELGPVLYAKLGTLMQQAGARGGTDSTLRALAQAVQSTTGIA